MILLERYNDLDTWARRMRFNRALLAGRAELSDRVRWMVRIADGQPVGRSVSRYGPPAPTPWPEPRPRPRVPYPRDELRFGEPRIDGDYDKALARRYVRRHTDKFSYCYVKALLVTPTLTGTVTVRFEIGADGKVTAATASGVDAAVADCVAATVRAIEFPAPPAHAAVTLVYPLTFRFTR